MPFLPPNQQHQSTEGISTDNHPVVTNFEKCDFTFCLPLSSRQSFSNDKKTHLTVSETDKQRCQLQQSHTHTHPFNGPFSRTTQVSEWQWHQLGHTQVCTSLQTDDHASTPPLFFTGRMPFLPPNQQRQSTEGLHNNHYAVKLYTP